MSDPVLLYGATGYTGQLVLEQMLAQGMRPVLSGRSSGALAGLAAPRGLEVRVAALDDAPALDAALRGMRAVLHCAGPFSRTAAPMAHACLRNGVHYLDITGEIAVFEALHALDARARAAGIALLPGVGFDVVPSDCLAAHLKRRLPTATELTLAFAPGTGPSHGTATTAIENIAQGGAVRRNGVITRVPTAWRTRTFDFADRARHAMTIPWGDVSTAYRSTGIPDISVYLAIRSQQVRLLRLARPFLGLLGTAFAQRLLKSRIRARAAGPSAALRQHARSQFWGEVREPSGRAVRSRLVAPDGYTLTALTAVAAVRRVLAGGVPAGFQTPAMAFGPDFILEFPLVQREDIA